MVNLHLKRRLLQFLIFFILLFMGLIISSSVIKLFRPACNGIYTDGGCHGMGLNYPSPSPQY